MANTIARRITMAREAARMSQSALARAVGLKSQSVNNWESGVTEPKLDNLVRVAEITGAPVEWLAFGGQTPQKDQDGKFTSGELGGRFLPLVSIQEALEFDSIVTDDKPHYPAHFTNGRRATFITVPDASCEPESPQGTRWGLDYDKQPRPGDKVLASVDGNGLLGEYSQEATPAGLVTIVKPLNPRWPAARSDIHDVIVQAVRTERVLKD